MHGQEDINAKMRAILVDWLVEVHMKFRLNPNTLYLCVNIIDRYCSKIEVRRSKLQLVGVTALLVACKHEEIYPPEVRDCVYITDRAYNRQEVLDMEQSILKELDWKISVPTAYPFLHRFLSLVEASTLASHAAHYYLERSLQEHDMLDYRPSEVAAAAVLLAINNPDILLHDEDYDGDLPGMVRNDLSLVYLDFILRHCSLKHYFTASAEDIDGIHWIRQREPDRNRSDSCNQGCQRAHHSVKAKISCRQEKV
jgi:cyclin B